MTPVTRPRRIAVVATHAITVKALMRGQLRHLAAAEWDVVVVTSPDPDLAEFARAEGVRVVEIPMVRTVAPVRDLLALTRFVRLFRQLRPDVVSAGTPKGGLLGMVAAWLARVPVRVYILRGLRLETITGVLGRIMRLTERMASACSTHVLSVSRSLQVLYVDLGLAPESKIHVLGAGSSNGVDTARFSPAARSPRTPTIGYVGRLTRDKGVADLWAAFKLVCEQVAGARLLVVGDFESADPVPEGLRRELLADERVTITGFVSDPAPLYKEMSVLVLPTRREGLPNAPLEAAASGVPVVAYAATGTVDAVDDGVTGALVGQGQVEGLAAAVATYLEDADLAQAHGDAGRARVATLFDSQLVWNRLERFYRHGCEGGAR